MIYMILFGGCALFFWDELLASVRKVTDKIVKAVPRLREFPKRCQAYIQKRRSLKAKVKILNEGKKENFLSAAYTGMMQTLAITGSQDKAKIMRYISFATGGVGILVAFYLRSWMLVPILGVGLGLIPMWLTKFRRYRYQLDVNEELSVALSMVTNSYLRTENILLAVEENLKYMREPIRGAFRQFLVTSKDVDPNIKGNLGKLSKRIDNRVFVLWCKLMMMCQDDINQKHSLNAIVNQLAQDKELYNKLSAELSTPILLYLLLAGISLLAFPLTAYFGQSIQAEVDSLEVLFTTVSGQIIVVGYVISLLFGLNIAIDLSTRIEK